MSDIKNFERNKYFYGKLMTVRDFETEQSYFIEKQRLINRLIHGAGVVCGLRVEKKDATKIKIYPGVAIDCCGREIIVPEAKVVDLNEEYSLDGIDKVFVLLKYDYCEKESVPVINNVSACEETCCYNRILETYKIEISKKEPDDCVDKDLCEAWLDAGNPEDFVEYWIKKGCPECPKEPAVLLAAIRLNNSTIDEIDNAIKDDDDKGIKKSLVFSNAHLYELIKCVEKQPGPKGDKGDKGDKGENGKDGDKGDTGDPGPGLEEGLTVITNITPVFEGKSYLPLFLKEGIKVTFSNKIESKSVNNDTFQVAVFAPIVIKEEEETEFLMHHYEYIEGDIKGENENDYSEVFTFNPNDIVQNVISQYIAREENQERKLKILVHIKCDFIKDNDGKAVAGHHLKKNKSGLNIAGNDKYYNIQGGIFESWFTLFQR